jgi:hypothetical protein
VAHISASEFKGLSVIDLADVGFHVPPTEDKDQRLELCDLLSQLQVGLPIIEFVGDLLKQSTHLHRDKLIVYFLLGIDDFAS